MNDSLAAQISKALGDPNRLAIYTQIVQKEECFCGEMVAKHTIGAATLSHHLKVLTELNLISSRKEGQNVFYRSIPETFAAYVQYLQQLTRSK